MLRPGKGERDVSGLEDYFGRWCHEKTEMTERGADGGRGRRVGERDGEFTLGRVLEVPEQQPNGTIQNMLDSGRSGKEKENGGTGRAVRGLDWRYKFGRCISL